VTLLEVGQREWEEERNERDAEAKSAATKVREVEHELMAARAQLKVLAGEVEATKTQVTGHLEGAAEGEAMVHALQEREVELSTELQMGEEIRVELELEKASLEKRIASLEKRIGKNKVSWGEKLIEQQKEKDYLKQAILGFMKAKEPHQRLGVLPVLSKILSFSEKDHAIATEAVRQHDQKPRGFFG
jgi:chromosome segregation ATPase